MRLSAFAATLLATTAIATAAAAASEGVAACTAEDAVFDRDVTIVGESMEAFNTGDFPAMKAHIKELEEVLSHAPDRINYVELCGETIVLRESSRLDAQATVNRVLVGEDRKRKVAWRPTPYTLASIAVGSFYVEIEDFAAADKALSVGMKLEPLHPNLVSEAALALSRLGRNDEALAVLDRALVENTWMEALDRARLLRTRGFSLIEMKRLDEAEAAYRDSLKFQPGHTGALGELDYISKLRKGGDEWDTRTVRSTTGEPSPEKVKP
ncbi:hypothetical protein [Caulobacter sp. 17J65-9]|uniref:hypothetical protein n=1 Tax=Caulobacter sp. 17J65-9 TaxID=2709382 RepID=UPI0013CB9283|nr:hypothetical protein [Caulobacter sp. 17J65-9]NEX94026.1 hypothetical protein [Caulobacter sp. 17J65-9]